MRIVTNDGHRRWMHKWTEPDGHNKKPLRRMAISRIILDGEDPKTVAVEFAKELHKKHIFAFCGIAGKHK